MSLARGLKQSVQGRPKTTGKSVQPIVRVGISSPSQSEFETSGDASEKNMDPGRIHPKTSGCFNGTNIYDGSH